MREVLTAKVQIGGQRGEWPVMVGLISNFFVPLIVGRYWPGCPISMGAQILLIPLPIIRVPFEQVDTCRAKVHLEP